MVKWPDEGLAVSKNNHNSKIEVICDWIESNALFTMDGIIYQSEIVDILCEENFYSDQDFAYEFIDNCWSEISRRQSIIGETYEVDKLKITRKNDWKNFPAYSFCLGISVLPYYNFKKKFSTRFYLTQGELFEKLTEEAIINLFPKWKVLRTGWSKSHKKNFTSLLKEIMDFLNVELTSKYSDYISLYQNDNKLDLILAKELTDSFCSIPIYFFQCASGKHWTEKRHEPNLEVWDKVIRLNSYPRKGFAIPYSLVEKEFIKNSPAIKGILLDRNRLNSVQTLSKDWVSKGLKDELNKFTETIIKSLPRV